MPSGNVGWRADVSAVCGWLQLAPRGTALMNRPGRFTVGWRPADGWECVCVSVYICVCVWERAGGSFCVWRALNYSLRPSMGWPVCHAQRPWTLDGVSLGSDGPVKTDYQPSGWRAGLETYGQIWATFILYSHSLSSFFSPLSLLVFILSLCLVLDFFFQVFKHSLATNQLVCIAEQKHYTNVL